MVKFNSICQCNVKRWLMYAIGFIAILAAIIVSSFYIAEPYLNDWVKRRMASRSITAEEFEISILGKINLKNVTAPVPAGVSLNIGAISLRPPISFIPSTFILYDVDLKYNNNHIQIPKVSINNITFKEKDATIASPLLRSIMRLEFSSIFAPNIMISKENENGITEKVNIKDFQLSGFKRGYIRSVGIKSMDLATVINGTKQLHLVTKSNAIKARNIDTFYAYSIIAGKSKATNQGEPIADFISLNDVIIDVFKQAEKISSFSLGAFKAYDLKMKPLKQIPEKLIKAYLNAKKENNQVTEKAARNAILINTLLAITSIEAEVDQVTVDAPQLNATLDSLQFKPSQWDQPIPKKILLSLDGFSVLPKKIDKEDLDFLKNINLERFDLSGKFNLSYDEKKCMLFLNAMAFNIKDIGSGEISAEAVNVDKKLFSGQKDGMTAALHDLGVTKIGIRYTDTGFIDKLFSYLAQKLDDGKHDLKKELYNNLYLMMTKSPEILLKNYAKAESISKYFGDFSKNPQTLIIEIMAKDRKGLTIDDFKTTLQNNLPAVLNKVNITVKNKSSP
ncbi:hypothetical protein V4P56_00965 [Bartonella sp. B35(2025)]